jgi:hypothetical protein
LLFDIDLSAKTPNLSAPEVVQFVFELQCMVTPMAYESHKFGTTLSRIKYSMVAIGKK